MNDKSSTIFLRTYWSDSLTELSIQTEAAKRFCESNLRLSEQFARDSFRDLVYKFLPDPKSQISTLEFGNKLDSNFKEDGEAITQKDEAFLAAFASLKDEIKALLIMREGPLWESNYPGLKDILDADLYLISMRYGSLTNAWDAFVFFKMALVQPNREVQLRSEWMISLVAFVEQSFRSSVIRTMKLLETTNGGKELAETISGHFASKMKSLGIENAFQKLNGAKGIFSDINKEADIFCFQIAAGVILDQLENKDMQFEHLDRGFCQYLREIGDDEDEIFRSIVIIRDRLLYSDMLNTSLSQKASGNLPEMLEASTEYCNVVAQFMLTECVKLNLRMMDSVLRYLAKDANKGVSNEEFSELKARAMSEVRVYNLSLLKKDLYWVAWGLSETAHMHFESVEDLMLQFNSAFARRRISEDTDNARYFSYSDVPEVREDHSVRYKILRKTLLKDWEGIEELMVTASVEKGNLSIDEFEGWPAFEYLRSKEFYKPTLTRIKNIMFNRQEQNLQ